MGSLYHFPSFFSRFKVLKAEGLEKYADVKSVTSELASAMDLTPEELEHVASELIEIASHRGEKANLT